MKILIVSDTHRKDDNLRRVIEEEKPIDMLIHLGDSEGSEAWIGDWVNEGCCLEMVMGNNDFFSSLERELELELRGHRILLTHGHYYNVSLGSRRALSGGLGSGMRYCHVWPYSSPVFGGAGRSYHIESGKSFLSEAGRA